jgi:uncharacterized protein YjiS (DUF1127 family)
MAAITTNSSTSAELTVSGFAHGMLARIAAAVCAMNARARARHDYRRLLENDELMRDVGIRRQDVRNALAEAGGRA